jgi:multidrug resistance efflux pump
MSRRWKVAAVLAVLAGAASALGFFWPFGRSAKELRLPGLVEIQEVRLAPRLPLGVSGRVVEVCVPEGTVVEAGAPLVRLAVPELAARRDDARARVASARSALDKAVNGPRPEEVEWAAAKVEVARARLKLLQAGSRPEEVRLAECRADAAQIEHRQADDELRRVEALRGTTAWREDESVLAQTRFRRTEANWREARANLDMVRVGTRPELLRQAERELEEAQRSYELTKAPTRSEDVAAAQAQLAAAEAQLREAEANAAEAVIAAPERLVVEVVPVRPGDTVTGNQTVVRGLRAADLWVKVFVPETELGKVRRGQQVAVLCDAFPGKTFQGVVYLINSESEFTPRNVQTIDERKHQVFGVRVRVADPDGVFKSGMFAEVVVPVGE